MWDKNMETEFGMGEFDLAKIFGEGDQAVPPVESLEMDLIETNTQQKTEPLLDVTASESTPANVVALPTAGKNNAVPEKKGLFEKLPVFSYGSAKESIQDTAMTFEELRIAKAEDFPELSDGKKVSWVLEYGKVTKTVPAPKETTIASMKEEVEQSKAFLDGLKKTKDKNPDCLVKPKVTAQSKGQDSYRGIFLSEESALASSKVICLYPAKDGQMYELRKTEMGNFVAPVSHISNVKEVQAGFTPALPLIPAQLMAQLVTFFRSYMAGPMYEAMAHIYWDRQEKKYLVCIPDQVVSSYSILAKAPDWDEQRYLHYAEIHSHNVMKPVFSAIDNADEKATGLYFVVGELDHYWPSISARISVGGTYQSIDPALVLELPVAEFPKQWSSKVSCRNPASKCGEGTALEAMFL